MTEQYREMLRDNPYKGTFIGQSPLDGARRTVSYRMLGKWPLLVQAALAEDDYLAEWRQEIGNVLTTAAVFSLFSLLLGLLGLRYWRSRQLTVEALKENRNLFHTFAKMSADWFWEQDAEYRFTQISGNVAQAFGVSEESMLGKRRQEMPIEVDAARLKEHLAQIEARQPFKDFEYGYRQPSGEVHIIRG